MEQMEQGMAEIFYDNGTLFFALPQGGMPFSPYWKTFMEIGIRCADLRTDDNGNCSFFDEDGVLMGIQMEDPVDESGAPKESVLHWLRQVMQEHELVMFLETVKSCHAMHAEDEQEDDEVFTFQIGPEGVTGAE